MVFACEKSRPYILGSHVVIHIDHAAIKYLMEKTDHMGATATRV